MHLIRIHSQSKIAKICVRKAGLVTKVAVTQKRMTWTQAEVLASSKHEYSWFLLYFPQFSFLYLSLFSSFSASALVYQCWPKVPDIQLSAAGELSCTLLCHRTHSSSNKSTPVWNLDLLKLLFLPHVILPLLLCQGFWAWGLFSSYVKIRPHQCREVKEVPCDPWL